MSLRERNLERLSQDTFDVLIVGGGINGAVSAAALAARGVKVALIDQRDFAGFTSQHSSNLVWGGIKYMESYDFRLVAGLCKSRNELMRSFPSTVKEIRFLTTISKGFRHHPVMLWLGTWLYWLFGRGYTRTPNLLTADAIGGRESAVDIGNSRGGVEYSDAYLYDNDARFVFNFIRSAIRQGCCALNYVSGQQAVRGENDLWRVTTRDEISGLEREVRSKVLINACGPYVDTLNQLANTHTSNRHVLSKGIHLIVPRIGNGDEVLAFFADDGRLFFAIPMAHRTCIGTTDMRVSEPETEVTAEDRRFVLSNINSRLNLPQPLTEEDVISERCGVRPLAVRNGSEDSNNFLQLSRKHIVETQTENAHISIFGGKLTDCLNVGDEICEQVKQLGIAMLAPADRWYGEASDEERGLYQQRVSELGIDAYTAADTGESLGDRLWRRYGLDAMTMLENIAADRSLADPAIEGTGISRVEIAYMKAHEMIVKLEDLLRRRSKLELIERRSLLESSPGLKRVCRELFDDQADEKWAEYFNRRLEPEKDVENHPVSG